MRILYMSTDRDRIAVLIMTTIVATLTRPWRVVKDDPGTLFR